MAWAHSRGGRLERHAGSKSKLPTTWRRIQLRQQSSAEKKEKTMTTDSGEKPNERDESQRPRERGGSAVDDMSKGLATDDSDSPFGGAGEKGEAKKEKRDE